jgi:hypothetical protein
MNRKRSAGMRREWGDPAPTHDLIRLRQPTVLATGAPVPSWSELALQRMPWVVVRRGHLRRGMLPVAVRGAARHRRVYGICRPPRCRRAAVT